MCARRRFVLPQRRDLPLQLIVVALVQAQVEASRSRVDDDHQYQKRKAGGEEPGVDPAQDEHRPEDAHRAHRQLRQGLLEESDEFLDQSRTRRDDRYVARRRPPPRRDIAGCILEHRGIEASIVDAADGRYRDDRDGQAGERCQSGI